MFSRFFSFFRSNDNFRNDDKKILLVSLFLSRLANNNSRDARILDEFLQVNSSSIRKHINNLFLRRTYSEGNKDFLLLERNFRELIIQITYNRFQDEDYGYFRDQDFRGRKDIASMKELRGEMQEIADYTLRRFLGETEKSVVRRLDDVGKQLESIEERQSRLVSESVNKNEQLELSKAEIQSYLWLLTTGADIASIDIKRYIPVRIYISDPVPSANELNALMSALDEFSGLIGFEKTGEFPSEQGSWWKQIFYRTKDAVSQKSVHDGLIKVEQAIQTHYLDKPQAEANAHQAQAVCVLVNALKEIPEACIQVGSLLLVKITGNGKTMVIARTLTAKELKLLEENQPMLGCPDRILEWLNNKGDSSFNKRNSSSLNGSENKDEGEHFLGSDKSENPIGNE